MSTTDPRAGVAVRLVIGILLLCAVGSGVAGIGGESVAVSAPVDHRSVEQHSTSVSPSETPVTASSSAVRHDGTTRLVGSVSDEDGEPILTAVSSVNDTDRETTPNNIGSYRMELEADDGNEEDDADGDDERSDEDETERAADTQRDVTGDDARDEDSPPLTNREQVLTVLFFAGTFLAAMISAATVGLYRNRSR